MKRFSIREIIVVMALCKLAILVLGAIAIRSNDSGFVNACLALEPKTLADVTAFANNHRRQVMPLLLQTKKGTFFHGLSVLANDGRRVEFRIRSRLDESLDFNRSLGWSKYLSQPVLDVSENGSQNSIADSVRLILDGG